MIVPLSGEVFETPEAIGRFARFLRELTGGLLAHDVHTAIAAYCELPGHDPRGDRRWPTRTSSR